MPDSAGLRNSPSNSFVSTVSAFSSEVRENSMRLSAISAGAVAIVAIALTACAGRGIVPSSPTGYAPANSGDALQLPMLQPPLTTCAKSPPQYDWIFKGACQTFTLKSTGGSFSLGIYQSITVKGSIGKNTAKGSVQVALADAVDKNGDILKWKGKTFPPYHANGTTVAYASAVNQSTQVIKPIPVRGKPVLQYVITDSHGLPGKTCGAAVLAEQRNHTLKWTALPATGQVKGKSVTISQYEVPQGFELPPKAPLYFGVNCF
jgi:hypothetical protein